MLECATINKNSKLYQKFLERKGKKEVQSSSPLCEPNLNKERMQESTNQSKKLQASMNNSTNDSPAQETSNQNIQRPHYPSSRADISKMPNLDVLLKKELSKNRSTSVAQERKIEPFQLYPHKKGGVKQHEMQLQLQNEYLAAQNKKLKQKLIEEAQKYQNVQQSLDQQRQKSRQIEFQLQRAIEQINSLKNAEMKHTQSGIASEEINKLKEQNHLAKQYLYKLTVKLYQSQQQNQKLQKEIDHMKETLSTRAMQAISPQHPSRSVRQRDFQNYKQESKEASLSKEPLAPSIPSSHQSSRENRILQIKAQLEQLNLLKVFNGKNRRRKIELQRQLQQLNLS